MIQEIKEKSVWDKCIDYREKNAKRHQMRRAKKGRAEAAALEIIIKPLIHRSLLQHQPASNIAKLVEEE